MPTKPIPPRRRRSPALPPLAACRWLRSATALAVLSATSPVHARDILRSGAGRPASQAAAQAASAAAQQAAAQARAAQAALQRSSDILRAKARVREAQAAAAAAGRPDRQVSDGLGGGLRVVENPALAGSGIADDGTNTWIGAALPTQTVTDGHYDVTVDQHQSRAILSWESFDVGANTSLTFDQHGNGDWVALNRVVGRGIAPSQILGSQILGSVKADGTVLVINQNGIVFGAGSQVNVRSLAATTLEIGRGKGDANEALTLAQRNQEFLEYGLLGWADLSGRGVQLAPTFASRYVQDGTAAVAGDLEKSIEVEAGASIKSSGDGFILLGAPEVKNAGLLSAPDGQVILAGPSGAGGYITLRRSDGSATGLDPDVRGLLAYTPGGGGGAGTGITNTGLIEAGRGSIQLGGRVELPLIQGGSVVNEGILSTTTSVSRNGSIELNGNDVTLAAGSVISITADDRGETIPQGEDSVANFKPSRVAIGDHASTVAMEGGATIYAPGGDITIGAGAGEELRTGGSASSIRIGAGAVIDVGGLKDVLVPASRNAIRVSPVKGNELRDSPGYRDSFLAGATVYVDPRLSGVRDDGVAWIGSPLIEAGSYYQQVGVTAAELMTRGGNVVVGTSVSRSPEQVSRAVVEKGAVVDLSGGWVRYQAGTVRTTKLIAANGRVVDIGAADPGAEYVGIHQGFTVAHPRWGKVETYSSPFVSGSRYVGEYTEGRDAGTLTVKAPAAVLEATLLGQAFAGARQIAGGVAGTGGPATYGDLRATQAAASQLPAGGMLFLQALGMDAATSIIGVDDKGVRGGGDIAVVASLEGAGDRASTIALSDDTLSGSGLSQVSLWTMGKVNVARDAAVTLEAGGVFDVLAGGTITVDGAVSAAGGKIQLETASFGANPPQPGALDVVVNGTLSVRGRWVNDLHADAGAYGGPGWLDGGSIALVAAPSVLDRSGYAEPPGYGGTAVDVSGSILVDAGALLDLSGGGRVDPLGELALTGRGGDLSLVNQTAFFQTGSGGESGDYAPVIPGQVSGFRVHLLEQSTSLVPARVAVNPDEVNARVQFDPASIRAQGFAGGGTFTLVTPEVTLGGAAAESKATALPLDFFSSAGFAKYSVTSYKTLLDDHRFVDASGASLGGKNAVLETQTLTVRQGQTLNLTQSMLPSLLTTEQAAALRDLASGGDLFALLSQDAGIPAAEWDRRPVELTLGGALELKVEEGGTITGAPGSALTVSKLLNEGTIVLPGGTIRQQELRVAPRGTAAGTIGVHQLSDAFAGRQLDDGTLVFDEEAANALGRTGNGYSTTEHVLTNRELAAKHFVYLLGELDQDQGIVLAPGSVTDLSGVSVRNPRAAVAGEPIAAGRLWAGGTLELSPASTAPVNVFGHRAALGDTSAAPEGYQPGSTLTVMGAEGGRAAAVLDLCGAADAYDEAAAGGGWAPSPVWSDGGRLSAPNGATLAGGDLRAFGGAPQAQGGVLEIETPTLHQEAPATPALDAVSTHLFGDDAAAGHGGFDTLVALGSVTSAGDVTLTLDRAFVLASAPSPSASAPLAPSVGSGGAMVIEAPYVAFASGLDALPSAPVAAQGGGSAVFEAGTIDVFGAVAFDASVARAELNAAGDVRFTGVAPWSSSSSPSLRGHLAVGGDLSITAGRVYPTTGSSFAITSSKPDGTISFHRPEGATDPAIPWSAGGSLRVQAAHVVQGGAVYVPLGTLVLGDERPYVPAGSTTSFAPATSRVELLAGAITSVAADRAIPYGTTTDGIEWYFAPTTTEALSAPPAKELRIGGAVVTLEPGTRVDVSGGGDVYAYEFSSGTGGSRDVLDRLNADPFSGNAGYQYPDGRQVYAIVPGLSDAPVAAYDPIYSSGYGSLYAGGAAGSRVYLDGAPGLPAGWYTLLPARYAMLPGGMRVVDMGNGTAVAAGTSARDRDGSLLLTGTFGDALSGASQSGRRLLQIMPQETIRRSSSIIITSGNAYFAAKAAHAGTLAPRLPVDAGRMVLGASEALKMTGAVFSAAAPQGKGSQVDIAGAAVAVVSELPATPVDGTLYLAAGDLTGLGAGSLLVGGRRTDHADGTTTLDVTASSLTVENDAAHPLEASEIVLAVGGSGSALTVADGAALAATGALADTRSGAYLIGRADDPSTTAVDERVSGAGSLVRIAAGPERLAARVETAAASAPVFRVGRAALAGTSVMFDGSGTTAISPDVSISGARSVALGADRVGLGVDPAGYEGLVITDALRGALAGQQGSRLTLRAHTAIDFAAGEHAFGDVRLDAPVLALYGPEGGAVTVTGEQVMLGNAGPATAACVACGRGTLSVTAEELVFGSGTVVTAGLGGGVGLTARGGVFAGGVSGKLDAGSAAVALHTPYLGDRGVAPLAGEVPVIADLTITTTGALTVDTGGAAPLDPSALPGVPGAGLSLQGNGVSITGTRLRATAGRLAVASQGDLTLAGGALLEAPGYSRTFGDAGSIAQPAPGGTLSLSAQGEGGIALGDATLSVGGGAGDAGRLELSAPNGRVDLGTARLDGRPGEGGRGGTFALDARSAIDLVALGEAVAAQGFTGGFEVRTREGNLVLAAGQTLRSGSVSLTADGGLVDVAGTIDTSGVNGGDVDLHGTAGVALRETAVVDAHAEGHADTDTRQARAGDVTLGTDGTGTLSIAAGAVIDLSARRTTDRVVPVSGAGGSFYQYVEADRGGALRLRAPVVEGGGAQTVAVAVADAASVRGAREVVLEGFRRFDLAAVAADPRFVGVTLDGGVVRLDTAATGAGRVNFLADDAEGTLVAFVQDFDVSASYGNLGGLASSAGFHARPGMELSHGGGITLESSWNLGAGVVDVPAAVAAGAMAYDPAQGGKPYVLPGKEAEVFARFTSMVYRTDGDGDGRGDVAGEPGILTFRAGGDLRIRGSISDGFFQFRDQTDPTFLGLLLGRGSGVYSLGLSVTTSGIGSNPGSDPIASWRQDLAAASPRHVLRFDAPQLVQVGGSVVAAAPYSAAANSPAAVSAGDAMGTAEVFPLLPGGRAADSWSYRVVAGADAASSDPLRAAAGSSASVTVEGARSYYYQAGRGAPSFSGSILVSAGAVGQDPAIDPSSPEAWLAQYAGRELFQEDDYTFIGTGSGPASLRSVASAWFAANAPGEYRSDTAGIHTRLDRAAEFLAYLDEVDPSTGRTRWSAATGTYYNAQLPKPLSGGETATYETLVRTGTGRIDVAAAGAVDLTNGAVAGSTSGTSLYTAGRRADPSAREAVDVATGRTVTVDPSGHLTLRDAFAAGALRSYTFGLGQAASSKVYGVPPVANPLYLEGGGDVRIEAGGDVRGRFDRPSSVGAGGQVAVFDGSYQGSHNEPWRVGAATGSAPDMRINPQQFRDGLGTLAGGDIEVGAGGSIVDLTAVATGGAWSASAAGADELGRPVSGSAWRSLGGGDVVLRAGVDLLGGHVDVVSGRASLSAGRDLASSGPYTSNSRTYDALLRVRLIDAEVSLSAGRQAIIGGVVGLKLASVASTVNGGHLPSWVSPGSGLSLVANGSVRMRNHEAEDLGSPYGSGDPQFPFPASLRAASLTGDLSLSDSATQPIVLAPSPEGQLTLLAGGSIAPASIAMYDGDPTLLPIPFGSRSFSGGSTSTFRRSLVFPAVFPDTTEAERRLWHDEDILHAGDPEPVQIHAGGDIRGMIVSVPKQARISAGRDIVDMMFFGQNLDPDDVTRIVAGRDVIATSSLDGPSLAGGGTIVSLAPRKALRGNTFVIGGPGSFFLEAGRDMGPFLSSAQSYGVPRSGSTSANTTLVFGGGVLSVGNEWNPWLPEQGADLYVLFGLGNQGGPDYHALRAAYVDPANLDRLDDNLREDLPQGYAPALASWLEERYARELRDAFGTEDVTAAQAYQFFTGLPELSQRVFLLSQVYFGELRQAAVPESASYQRFSRGYRAVDTLFPAERGFTENGPQGGAASEDIRHTGDLDLRLATIQTARGGDVRILGPGGRVLAGSVVRTSTQAARLAYLGEALFGGRFSKAGTTYRTATVAAIPSGFEGVLTLRGGVIETFTDGDFVLNQSRLFTQGGGSIVMWSSNGDLNAGQGPKTSANFPPVTVKVSPDAWFQVDAQGGVSGAGIAAFQPSPDVEPPDVYLLAPRGTVDAGDAGVRVAGNLSIVANYVANADNLQVGGQSFGVPTVLAPNLGAMDLASDTAGATAAVAGDAARSSRQGQGPPQDLPSIITVEVVGYEEPAEAAPAERRRDRRGAPAYDPNSAVQVKASGEATEEEPKDLDEEKRKARKRGSAAE